MAGFFDSLVDEDEPTSFFGGYRPPAASPSAGLTAPVSNSTPAPQSTPDATAGVLTYPDGTPVIDPFGHPYQRPPTLDMRKNLSIGDQINDQFQNSLTEGFPVSRDLLFAPFFPAGAMMDYKRPDGLSGPYQQEFRPVSYYNYGVMAAKVGYGREEALRNAGLYNRYFGGPARNPYSLDGDDAEEFIKQGFNDYTNGSWAPKSAD